MSAITTALSGLQASVDQLTASASNVANAQTSGPLAASGFGPATILGSPGASGPALQAYQPVSVVQSTAPGGGVATSEVPVSPATSPAYDPASPSANAQGLVAMPNVDLSREMVGQMGALNAFKANLATLKVADEMQQSLLAIA